MGVYWLLPKILKGGFRLETMTSFSTAWPFSNTAGSQNSATDCQFLSTIFYHCLKLRRQFLSHLKQIINNEFKSGLIEEIQLSPALAHYFQGEQVAISDAQRYTYVTRVFILKHLKFRV